MSHREISNQEEEVEDMDHQGDRARMDHGETGHESHKPQGDLLSLAGLRPL